MKQSNVRTMARAKAKQNSCTLQAIHVRTEGVNCVCVSSEFVCLFGQWVGELVSGGVGG